MFHAFFNILDFMNSFKKMTKRPFNTAVMLSRQKLLGWDVHNVSWLAKKNHTRHSLNQSKGKKGKTYTNAFFRGAFDAGCCSPRQKRRGKMRSSACAWSVELICLFCDSQKNYFGFCQCFDSRYWVITKKRFSPRFSFNGIFVVWRQILSVADLCSSFVFLARFNLKKRNFEAAEMYAHKCCEYNEVSVL